MSTDNARTETTTGWGGYRVKWDVDRTETTTATIEDKSVIERAAMVITANTDEPMWSAVVIAKEMASRGLLATAPTRPTRDGGES